MAGLAQHTKLLSRFIHEVEGTTTTSTMFESKKSAHLLRAL